MPADRTTLHLLAGGRRIAPCLTAPGYWLFPLPYPVPKLRLVSTVFRPAELGLSADHRRLGVALTRLSVIRPEATDEIPLTALHSGCHPPEGEGGWRWTTGDTPLPEAAFAGRAAPAALLVQGFGAPDAVAAAEPALFLPGDSHPADSHVPTNLFGALHPVFAGWRIHGPPRTPPVAERLTALLAEPAPAKKLILFGRSSGLRTATAFAAARPGSVHAVIGVGYPFLQPGAAPEPERFAHLAAIATPTLIIQGRQDAYGGLWVPDLVPLSPAVQLHFITATHELHLTEAVWGAVARRILLFLAGLSPP
jgi:pimeloyl-ACP methyl ester carboxylesterase